MMRTTKKWVIAEAARLDVQVDVFSPGDGATRYQFHCPAGKSPMCRGATEAWTWLSGFALGLIEGQNRQTPATLAKAVGKLLEGPQREEMLDMLHHISLTMKDLDDLQARLP